MVFVLVVHTVRCICIYISGCVLKRVEERKKKEKEKEKWEIGLDFGIFNDLAQYEFRKNIDNLELDELVGFRSIYHVWVNTRKIQNSQ